MSRNTDWEDYVDGSGDFEIAAYLYQSILELMKHTLDMGTLLSTDRARLRAYKEQVKQIFKGQWTNIAEGLEYYDLVTPCGCDDNEFCRICKGSRYTLGVALSADEIREISLVVNKEIEGDEMQERLQRGMEKAMLELKESGLI